MKEDWGRAITFVLSQEGGYINDPRDPGLETNFGISKKSYPNLDVRNLTVDEAKALYLKDYWIPCSCDELPTSFAIGVFDTAVNQGVTKAKRLLQMALNVTVDGIIGPKTIAAAVKAGQSQIKRYLAERLAEYARLMVANPKLLVFAFDWSLRVINLSELILNKGEIKW